MEFYKIYKSCIINRKIKKCNNTNNNYIKEILKIDDDKKTSENNTSSSLFKTNLGVVFK
jgi:hypothetical protein